MRPRAAEAEPRRCRRAIVKWTMRAGSRHTPRTRTQRRAGRSEAARRLAFLCQLRPILCSGADPVSMLQRVARLASRTLCEFCIVDVVNGCVRRVEIAHADAGLLDRLRAIAEDFVPRPGGRIERIVASREPELVAEVRRSRTSRAASTARRAERQATPSARAAATWREDFDFWESFAPASYMAVPIEARGELVAVMTFAAGRTPLRFDEDRLAFAREVAAWCGLALEAAQHAGARGAITMPPLATPTEPPMSATLRAKETG